MKKIMLLLLPVVIIAGCSSPIKLMLKEWRVDEVEFMDTLNTLTVLQKKNLSQNLQSKVRFTFLADSVFRVQNDTVFSEGKWWLSKDRKKLYTFIQDKTTEAKIYTINKDLLRFESVGDINQSFIFNCVPVGATGTK